MDNLAGGDRGRRSGTCARRTGVPDRLRPRSAPENRCATRARSGDATREGAYAVGRTAMSADGSKVAFVTTAVSDLVAYPAQEEAERGHGETPAPHTPAAQVAVHDFDTGATELVSRCRFGCGQGAAAGAAEPVVTSEEESRTTGAADVAGNVFPAHAAGGQWPGASISADGSTVAWMGSEPRAAGADAAPGRTAALYVEPLWERLPAAASQARRVTGGSDPESPACAASGESSCRPPAKTPPTPARGRSSANRSGPIDRRRLPQRQRTVRPDAAAERARRCGGVRRRSQARDPGQRLRRIHERSSAATCTSPT